MPVDPTSGVFAPRPVKTKTIPKPPPGFTGQGGTFTSGGFIPAKPKVTLPPDQAPYKHGLSPDQTKTKALAQGGEVKLVDAGAHPQAVQRAAQTMAMQRLLNAKGAHVTVDGVWGPNTEIAYQAYLHHAAQYTKQAQQVDASRNPLFQQSPSAQTTHEQMLLQQEAERRVRAAGNSPQVRPQQTLSDTRRYAPAFKGEPVAGWEGALGPNGTPIERPYYTDAATHQKHAGEISAANDQTQFEAMFGKQTEQDLQQTPKVASPALTGALETVGSALPGVGLARAAESGHLTGHSVVGEVANDLLWLGPSELAAPFKFAGGVLKAGRSGADMGEAARAAVALWRDKKLARVQNPIIRRDLNSSPDRQSFIAAIRDVPKLTGTEQHALLQVADHNAIARAAQTGEKPSIAWGKANFGKSTFHDLNPTKDEALGALAQTGEGTHFQRADLTGFPPEGLWSNPASEKDLKDMFTRPGGVPFVSKLHALVADMPPKVGVNELLGKIKSAGIKTDEIRWNKFDEFLASATAKGQKSVTREEALGWLDKNYLQIEENRRFQKPDNSDYGYGHSNEANSDTTKFHGYTLPGGAESNYQEFTIRLPSDQYGDLYEYTGHYPDSNILAHARTTDRTVAGDKTLMVEEIQSDWHQAGQKQGYKMPVTEHPDYEARKTALEQANADAEAIQARIRRTITDGVFNHPSIPGIPEALRPAFERGGETSLGINLTDKTSVRDWIDNATLTDDVLKMNPDARAQIVEGGPSPNNYDSYSNAYSVRIGDNTVSNWRQYSSDVENSALTNASNQVAAINRYIDMPPAERAALRDQMEAYKSALAAQTEKRSLMQALESDASRGVANAPFAKTWHELAFKRMLAEAVDKGYERIAWTTGRTQSERYNLANFFNRIEIKDSREYSGGYSDALYEWADEYAQNTVSDMNDEELGLSDSVEADLREQASESYDYPSEDGFYVVEDEHGYPHPASYEDDGAVLDQDAYDEAMDEYLSNVDDRYESLVDEWRTEARDSMIEAERDYYMENAHEYDSAPKEGDLLVQAQGTDGHTHEYTASRDSSEENALENVIGPDLAQRYHENGETTFEGEGLVAGENAKSALGASHFYDNKLTGFVNKYLKKTGVQSSMDEIGGTIPFKLRIELVPRAYDAAGHTPNEWKLEGHGVNRKYGSYFDALDAQHALFGDIPKATILHEAPLGYHPRFDVSDGNNVYIQWSDFPKGAKPSTDSVYEDLGGGVVHWGARVWGPFDDVQSAALEVEDTLIRRERDWGSADAQGTVVHSIPVTDEVRKFVDQGIVLFQRDPLVKEIARQQKLAPRMKGAVEITPGEKTNLHLFAAADVSTVVHELGHAVQDAIPALAGIDPETFARSFERYFMTAKAPTENLTLPFADIREGMRAVYGAATKVPGAKLTPKMKSALDSFFKAAEKEHPDILRSLSAIHFQPGNFEISDVGTQPSGGKFAIAKIGGEDVGHITVHPVGGGKYEVSMVRVAPDFQRRGIARALFKKVEAEVGPGNLLHQSNPDLLSEEGAAFKKGMGGETHFQAAWGDHETFDQPKPKRDRRGKGRPSLEQLNRDRALVGQEPQIERRGVGKPAVAPKDLKFQEGDPIKEDSLATTHEPISTSTPEEVLRAGMKGVKLRRGIQDKMRSEERAARARAYAEALSQGEGIQGHYAALRELKGELPKIDYHGFKELDPEALNYLVNTVRDHPHLLPYQKTRLITALDKATQGTMPTPSEQVLIEHVFGKDTARGFQEIAGLPQHLQNLVAEILNVPRSIMASFDLSAPFRQGLVVGTRHPGLFFSNFPAMFKAFGSERVYQAIMDEVRHRPSYPMMVQSKLAITDMEAIDNREEQFYSNLAERLTGGVRSPIRMSGRAYTAFLVKTRADVFDHLLRVAERQGRDVQDEKFLKDLGRYINAASGRGNLAALQGAAPALNTIFFSPRLLASRIDLLAAPITYARADPFVRRQALISMLSLGGVAATILGMASLLPGVTVNLDPRNADFGKIRFGNTRLDILGGFQQPFRLVSQFASGKIISSTTGDPLVLGPAGPGGVSRQDIVKRFFEGKLAPVPSIINDWMKGQNFQGGKLSWSQEATSHMIPLLAQDAADLYKREHGGMNGIALALAGYGVGAFGVGLQTYGPKDAAKAPTEKLDGEAQKAGMPGPTPALLIDVKHQANLDSLSQKHANDPQGRLDAFLKYYASETGDHEYDKWLGKKLPDDAAQQGADAIRHALVGPGLAQYEEAIRASLKAQGKKW